MGWARGSVSTEPGTLVNRSGPKAGNHWVMAEGNAAWRNARPTNAGLKALLPSPPNKNLATPTPKTPPTNTIHRGSPGGKVKPYSKPVMVTDQSPRDVSRRARRFSTCSVRTQERMAVSNTSSAPSPKAKTANTVTGSSASTTLAMMVCTLAPLATWGEDVICKVLLKRPPSACAPCACPPGSAAPAEYGTGTRRCSNRIQNSRTD